MLNKKLRIISLLLLLGISLSSSALYGSRYCKEDWVSCIKVKPGQSWESLWPDPYQRDLVQRLNRLNIPLQSGMKIAVPKDLSLSAMDIAPFERKRSEIEHKTIVVSPALLAWGAYDAKGNLLKWGPISAGKDFCPDIGQACHSRTGEFSVYSKQDAACISTKFPVDESGGAPMPYCMFYSDGYALHGSPQVPGYNASHGCIRLFTQDAYWLNQVFGADKETTVVVLPYEEKP